MATSSALVLCFISIILDVTKYCDHPRWYEKYLQEVRPPVGGETSDWRWDLQLELEIQSERRPPIGSETTNWRWDLQSELGAPIRGETSNQRWDLQLEVGSPIRRESSNQKWYLQSQVGPPIRSGSYNWSSHLQLELPPAIRPLTSDWSSNLWSVGGTDMGSQVDMYTCTDASTHSNQGMGTKVGSFRHNHSSTQGHSGFHITI